MIKVRNLYFPRSKAPGTVNIRLNSQYKAYSYKFEKKTVQNVYKKADEKEAKR